jgi:hypothetical protein
LGWRRGADSERSAVGMEGLGRERRRGVVRPQEETDATAIAEGDGGGVGAGQTLS